MTTTSAGAALPRLPESRITRRFEELRRQRRGGLITFITAGDPDRDTCAALLDGLPRAGADLIELGIPFTDPMADGPSIQAASRRALAAGMTLAGTLDLARRFRDSDADTPLVLMGYYNPVHAYGPGRFAADAARAGVDGLIVVDMPPEEDAELRDPATAWGLDLIRLAAPTTDDARLPAVVTGASGFLYFVSITGITGTAAATDAAIEQAVARLRRHTRLPVAVGFGIRTPERAAAVARRADAAVVGSAIVDRIAAHLDADGRAGPGLVDATLDLVGRLAAGVRGG